MQISVLKENQLTKVNTRCGVVETVTMRSETRAGLKLHLQMCKAVKCVAGFKLIKTHLPRSLGVGILRFMVREWYTHVVLVTVWHSLQARSTIRAGKRQALGQGSRPKLTLNSHRYTRTHTSAECDRHLNCDRERREREREGMYVVIYMA